MTFFYVLFTGCLVQCLILPYLFPDLHAGDGLLKGMDTVAFNHQALALLDQMKVQGWSVWSLRPDGMNSPPGIMAAMYYLFLPKPFILLFLNGFLWGITAVTWLKILECLFPQNGKRSMIPVLLIIALPSSWQWTTQFLKDIVSITGVSLVFYALIQSVVARDKDGIATWLRNLGIPLLLGFLLIWIARPYLLQFLVAGSLAVFLVVALACLVTKVPYKIMGSISLVLLLTLLLNFVINSVFRVKDPRHDRLNLAVPMVMSTAQVNPINVGFIRLQHIRDGYCFYKNNVGSAIDCDIKMNNIIDAIAYLPRALEVALLSPFPDMWLGKAKNPGGKQMRLIAGMEVVVATIIFLWALILLMTARVRFSLPLILGATYLVTPLLIETYATPEIGTLYRMRYIFWTGLMAMALSVIIYFFKCSNKTLSRKPLFYRTGHNQLLQDK